MKELTIEETGRFPSPLNMCFDKQYLLVFPEEIEHKSQIGIRKGMQYLTHDDLWEDIKPSQIIFPFREVNVTNKKECPIMEFSCIINSILKLKKKESYIYITLYHIELPEISVLTAKGEIVDYYKYKIDCNNRIQEYSISASFSAIRKIDKRRYISKLRNDIKSLENEICRVEKA